MAPKYKLKTISPKKSPSTYNCDKCGLYTKVNRPEFGIYGNKDSKLMIVGNCPDKECDGDGVPFAGENSSSIRNIFLKNRIHLKKDASTCFAVSCNYKKKSTVHPKCCRSLLVEHIQSVSPNLIIAIGETAILSILNIYGENLSITQLRGRIIPSHEFNCLIFPVFGMEDIYKPTQDENGNWKIRTIFDYKQALEWDLRKILNLWHRKYHKISEVKKILNERNILKDISITQIKTVKELEKAVEIIRKNKSFSYDYETTNAKPYDEYFEVYYVGLGIKNKAWVIYVKDFDNIEKAKEIILNLLQDPDIQVNIQGAKFEELSSRIWFNKPRQRIINNSFCTLLGTHIIDEREKTNSLDFQNIVRFGIIPYDGEIKKYLKKKNKDDKVNTIHLAPVDKMVYYNGMDVITTQNNAEVLQNVLIPGYEKNQWCYDLLYEGDMRFADIQEKGINIDIERLESIEEFFEEKKNELIDEIIHIPSVKNFFGREITGDEFETFLNSPKQLQQYLYTFCKLKPIKKTSKGENFSTDKEVIKYHAERDDEPLCKKLIEYRGLNKAKSTYVDDIKRNICEDGRLHYGFLMFGASSFRPSSTDPNVLNFPKHDDIIPGVPWTIIREVFVPTYEKILDKEKGDFIFLQVDMTGFELYVGAGISGDPKFIKDVNETDIHAREAVRIFELDCDPSEVKKRTFIFDGKEFKGGKHLRFQAKNNGVFASIYGSNSNSIARNMRLLDSFISFAKDKYKKIKTKLSFQEWFTPWSEEHLKNWQQEQFFKDYTILKESQESTIAYYKQNGLLEFPMGFRNHYPLTRNEILNRNIQGTAWLNLLYALIHIHDELKKKRFRTSIVLSVYDDILFDAYKPEIYDVIEMADRHMLANPDLPQFEFSKYLKLKNEWTAGYRFSDMKDIHF